MFKVVSKDDSVVRKASPPPQPPVTTSYSSNFASEDEDSGSVAQEDPPPSTREVVHSSVLDQVVADTPLPTILRPDDWERLPPPMSPEVKVSPPPPHHRRPEVERFSWDKLKQSLLDLSLSSDESHSRGDKPPTDRENPGKKPESLSDAMIAFGAPPTVSGGQVHPDSPASTCQDSRLSTIPEQYSKEDPPTTTATDAKTSHREVITPTQEDDATSFLSLVVVREDGGGDDSATDGPTESHEIEDKDNLEAQNFLTADDGSEPHSRQPVPAGPENKSPSSDLSLSEGPLMSEDVTLAGENDTLISDDAADEPASQVAEELNNGEKIPVQDQMFPSLTPAADETTKESSSSGSELQTPYHSTSGESNDVSHRQPAASTEVSEGQILDEDLVRSVGEVSLEADATANSTGQQSSARMNERVVEDSSDDLLPSSSQLSDGETNRQS